MFSFENTLAKTAQLKKKDSLKVQSDCPSFQITKGPQREKLISKPSEWTINERKTNVFQRKPQSQLWEQYKEMAKFIKTRNYRQCKIYHQKQTSQFQNTIDIIKNLLKNTAQILDIQLEKERKAYQIFCIAENKKVEIEQQAEKDKGLQPTGVDYDKEDKIPNKITQQVQIPSITSFPPQFESYQPFQGNSFGFYGYQSQTIMERPKKPTNEDWMQCHQLFLQYITKLNQMRMKQWSI